MIKIKKQVLIFAAALAVLILASLVLLRYQRTRTTAHNATPPRAAPADSLPDAVDEARPLPFADSSIVASKPDSTLSAPTQIVADSSTQISQPQPVTVSDTLRRYGAQATTMQMLIELLEEKQLLMEEKVELARRLEIAEILDSALVVGKISNGLATMTNDSAFAARLDSLTQRLPLSPADSVQREEPFPPRR